MSWAPGPRPAWVDHVLAGEGGPLYDQAHRPLVVDELVAEAQLRAGVGDRGADDHSGDDYSGDDFLEPLGVFVRSVEEEGDLHLVGRWRVREVLLRTLESRFRLVRWVGAHPAVRDEPIDAPIVVTGSPRAGTSIVHQLLALLPGARAPLAWEYWWPAPPPVGDDDPRIALANRDVRLSAALVPGFDGAHEQGALIPREDMSAMQLALRSDVLATHYAARSYGSYLASCDMGPAYDMHRLVLQTLQYERPRPVWVVKAPGHLAHLDLILARYPEARIVVCHRDPLAMISSVTSLTAMLQWAHSNHVDYQGLARANLDQLGRHLDHVLDLRQRGVLTDERVVDVRFDDLVGDHVGVVEAIAGHFGLPFERAPLEAHLAANPRGRHGDHQHSFDDIGLDAAAERARFDEYMSYFSIKPEV